MTDLFIKKAKLIHGDKYDYSKVDYRQNKNKIIIICKEHGEFEQTPNSHLLNKGCSKCGLISRTNKRKTTINKFIEKAISVHGDKYDYSKVDYINSHTKIIIICKKHGEFQQIPCSHLSNRSCPKCGIITSVNKRKTPTNEFIEKAILVHGDKYDYSKVDYINSNTKVIIICKEHGEFEQMINNHLNGFGCSKCSGMAKSNTEEFIEKAILVHGDKYDYSKVDYKQNKNKVIIICKEHGEFEQKPISHLNGQGCSKCYGNEKSNTEEFIEKSMIIHGNKYDYSKVDYINVNTKIIVICKIHGEFEQTPNSHLAGSGCNNCAIILKANKISLTTDEFIEKAILVHGEKYDYSKVDYTQNKNKVIIICKIHGDFLQTPNTHYRGSGCPKCSNNGYSKPSILWLDFLSKFHNIHIQHALNDGEFLIPNTKYKADGYCKKNNTIYEFHGDFWHGNPKIYKGNEINKITNCTYNELYEKTLIKENKIKELGYNLETIWENDWKKINNCIKIIQLKFLQKIDIHEFNLK